MSRIDLPVLPEHDDEINGQRLFDAASMLRYAEQAVREALAARASTSLADERRCEYCDGTGDVHSIEGEWRGICVCPAGRAIAAQKNDERAAFEYWASDEGEASTAVERAGYGYRLAQIQTYWIAWQARAALYTYHQEPPCPPTSDSGHPT